MGRYLSFSTGIGISLPTDGDLWFDSYNGELRDIPAFEIFPDRSEFSNPDDAEFDADYLDEQFFELFLPEKFPALILAYSYNEDWNGWSAPLVFGESTYAHYGSPVDAIPQSVPVLTSEEEEQLEELCILLGVPYEPQWYVAVAYG